MFALTSTRELGGILRCAAFFSRLGEEASV